MKHALQTLRYTTAPVDLDCLGTRDHGIVGENAGRPVRLVGIGPDALWWQESHYANSMHTSHSKDYWENLCIRGLAKWNEPRTL